MNPLPHSLEAQLRPYQVQPARQLFRALCEGPEEWGYPGGVDLSDVGTGKTYQDLAAALATGRNVGVLCPPAGRMGWEAAFSAFGATPAFIESWEAVRGGFRPNIARRTANGFLWGIRNLLIVADEAQTCRNPDSLTTFAMEGIFGPRIPTICASATLAIAPYELYIAGRITGLHDGTEAGWVAFCRENGCVWDEKAMRWRFRDGDGDLFPSHLARLNSVLIPSRGCRVRKEDTGEQADTSIRLLVLETPEAEGIRERYTEGKEIIARLKDQGTAKNVIEFKEMQLRVSTLKACEMSLVAPVAEMVKRDLDEERSVVAFFTYSAPRIAMSKILNRWEGLYGGISPIKRKHWVADFQADRLHVLLNNIGSGGSSVSLHDLHGNRPRSSYIMPTTNPIHAGQAPGRIHRSGGLTDSIQWLPCIEGTLSKWVMGRTAQKLNQLARLNNG